MSDDALAALLDQAEQADDVAVLSLLDRLRAEPALNDADGGNALRAARLLAEHGDYGDLRAVAALAGRAHQAGVAGAGPVFASAADKISLLSGRPQPFGTVTVEHMGDIVQPPVDRSTTDAERAEMGIPPLAELRQQALDASRRLAEERAGQPGVLPPGQQFCRVWTNPTPEELRARMAAEGTNAWADGDVLTLVAESDIPVAATPVFQMPSWPAGDGLQVLSLRVNRLDEAVITYTFHPLDGVTTLDMRRGAHDGRYRGPNAPAEAPSNDPVKGTLFDHALESTALGEPRRVTVYRPPGHTVGEDIPVVYATDGNMFAPYARRLDAAIEAGTCPRVLVVAAYSAPADLVRGNQRALEYLSGFDDRRFDAHQRFFVSELAAWAEAELGANTDRAKRAVFGCSDGGGHALSTGRLHRHRFGHVFAYSTGTPPEPALEWDPDESPFIHLCAGTLEGPFHQATSAWAGYLHMFKAPYHFTERVAGHDLIQWCEELPLALTRAWG